MRRSSSKYTMPPRTLKAPTGVWLVLGPTSRRTARESGPLLRMRRHGALYAADALSSYASDGRTHSPAYELPTFTAFRPQT